MNKQETLDAAKNAFGEDFNAQKYWEWRNKYKDCSIKREDTLSGKVKLTYPCGHNVIFKLSSKEMGKMMLSNFHHPECPSCRDIAYVAACKEREKRNTGLSALGLVKVSEVFPSEESK